jgi:hypothetical protein
MVGLFLFPSNFFTKRPRERLLGLSSRARLCTRDLQLFAFLSFRAAWRKLHQLREGGASRQQRRKSIAHDGSRGYLQKVIHRIPAGTSRRALDNKNAFSAEGVVWFRKGA